MLDESELAFVGMPIASPSSPIRSAKYRPSRSPASGASFSDSVELLSTPNGFVLLNRWPPPSRSSSTLACAVAADATIASTKAPLIVLIVLRRSRRERHAAGVLQHLLDRGLVRQRDLHVQP